MADLTRAFPIDSPMATLLAPISQREIDKAYRHNPPTWGSMMRRTAPTYFGRKRRARRARGRRRGNA
jgi:hypothetical protein